MPDVNILYKGESIASMDESGSKTLNTQDKYCEDNDIPDDIRRAKVYIIRSLIYGAALMFDNGEFEYCGENMEIVRSTIEREILSATQPNP